MNLHEIALRSKPMQEGTRIRSEDVPFMFSRLKYQDFNDLGDCDFFRQKKFRQDVDQSLCSDL